MAQLIVRNIEDEVRDRLRAMAAEHGRSMEEEVREILRAAALRESSDARGGLGSRISERLAEYGLESEADEMRGQPAKPADFELSDGDS